jgi:hypothetical protein
MDQMRQIILTKAVLASIPALVEQGLNTEAIAARLGCKVSTLKVRCSQAQVSLRVPKELKVVPLVPLVPVLSPVKPPEPLAPVLSPVKPPEPPKQKRSHAFALPTTLQLSRVAMARLCERAAATGITEAQLATDLLEMIAQDDLYEAVLDNKAKNDRDSASRVSDNIKLVVS